MLRAFYTLVLSVVGLYALFGSENFLVRSNSLSLYGISTSDDPSSCTTEFSLKRYLEERRLLVEDALDRSLTSSSPYTDKIINAMRYSLLAGGKRIRPILVLATTEMFGGDIASAMPTAVAVEMIHTMSLIHDDLPAMDNDTLRRRQPTSHVKYGEDIAILAGDALLTGAFEHVSKYTPMKASSAMITENETVDDLSNNYKGVAAERIVEVIRRLASSVGPMGLAGGQVKDLECENKADMTMEEIVWIHLHKTAALLKVAAATGAILAGANAEEVKACELYAEKIGLAFQIADDILDVIASSTDLGKTAGKDEFVSKSTYVKLLGLEGSKAEALRAVDEAKEVLARFGDRAIPLLALADFIVMRKN